MEFGTIRQLRWSKLEKHDEIEFSVIENYAIDVRDDFWIFFVFQMWR